ncbi:G_PROTEIN_RECEP_F1_2 domain-containing protein [Caenorhabditis elegans]|uniref:G_PROTEIN_RECEP_F1_2 domain-containing protein n=1 Tax=Caenorhabditis elegans TaxID=6239 RepID=Q22118_CAEEL|nr:G_PROTEIN_RECEP_F1_2 domain-containing protein [Caenorhabditis elegans]CAA98521.2 G_PROTEIN_RECEP_F1_2 domain-containing protein [Caenorhabditis elegans]|eukprot:NP_505868.2 Uncharacterized protein CELE_T03F7.6 [Caenorhabditis elegans]
MVFWETVLIGNYILALIGFIANIFYFKLVVFNKSFDVYCRIASLIIGSATTILIVSNVVSTSICLSYGSYLNTGVCLENVYHISMIVLHSYGEFSIASGIFILIFERYASVFFPSFRLSNSYKYWFSCLMILFVAGLGLYLYMMNVVKSMFSVIFSTIFVSILYLISFILVMYLFCAAKRRYYETLGIVSLTRRYLLSESFELCRSSLPATICCLAINISLFLSFWCLIFGIIPFIYLSEYFVLANTTLNLTATVFPILFLAGSTKIRKKIAKINPFQQFEEKVELHFEFRQLNGNRINISQSQNEYFEQLQISWS